MGKDDNKLRFETNAIKSIKSSSNNINPVSIPIYLSTTYERNPDGSYEDDLIYSRHSNPNRQILENSICQMEGGEKCYAFSSGMAAASAIFQSLKTGDHVLLPDDVYFNIYMLVEKVFSDWGLEYSKVDMSNPSAIQSAIKSNTRLIWIETPSNPQLKISDISAIVQLAKKQNILTAVDNTWATPVLQKPINHEVDIVIHSTTKYFGGHSDVLGGCVVLKEDGVMAEKIHNVQTLSGGVPSPFDCWLISRGIQTLYLRVTAQTKSAHALAEFLNSHSKIEKVNYPGLKSHPQYDIASNQMNNGFGAMLSVLVMGNEESALAVSNKLSLFTTATSLGGVESLVEHRKSVEGSESNTPVNLLRISVGLENTQDLIADWSQALEAI